MDAKVKIKIEPIIKIEDIKVDQNSVQEWTEIEWQPVDKNETSMVPLDLYSDHEIKEEVAVGPVTVQQIEASGDNNSSLGMEVKSDNEHSDDSCTFIQNLAPQDLESERYCSKRKSFCCVICNKSYKTETSLNRHKTVHNENTEKRFVCDICDNRYTQKVGLTNHMMIHTGERPYECEICNKHFAHQNSIREHLMMHSGLKPYACSVCHKKFTLKSNLTKHMATHSEEKRFVCELCNKHFTFKVNLTEHMNVHTKEKPYICKVCNKCFGHSRSLAKHAILHTGERPFACNICDKSFTLKYYLTRHLKAHDSNIRHRTNIISTEHSKKRTRKKLHVVDNDDEFEDNITNSNTITKTGRRVCAPPRYCAV